MAIMVATTKITVRRPSDGSSRDPEGEGYGTPSDTNPAYSVAHSGIRATIIPNTGRTSNPGDTEFTQYQLACDPIDLSHNDLVDDEITGDTFLVEWAHTTPGIAGLDHTNAGLSTIDPQLGAPE